MQKIDILIPVFIDTQDRISNLERVIAFLSRNELLNIYVREYYRDTPKFNNIYDCVKYSSKKIEEDYFNKMECVNELFEESDSDFIAIYDADVLIYKKAFYDSIELMNNGSDVVYPYNGYFYNIPKNEQASFFTDGKLDLDRCILWNTNSCGGCVIFKRQVFEEGGKCNPNFKNVGYDDNEIYIRFTKLEFTISRTKNPLLHMDHIRMDTAFGNNLYDDYNANICRHISNMTKEELIQNIKTW